jgi:hypothetical protein
MTDISKYRNVSLTHKTYNTLQELSKVLLSGGTPLSISKTVAELANIQMKAIQKKKTNGKGK